ncbi:hypothetical protein [Streptomyces sp. 8N706]|uniref:hypothetical protein n=1 Tax=Streptomyces sp. 8N706 TaxID=3457416 RepID=UPI003FD0CDEE
MRTLHTRRLPHHVHGLLVAAVALLGLLMVLTVVIPAVSAADDDTPPRCPVSRSGSGDLVPAGPRPCVLYGAGTGIAPGHDGRQRHGGGSGTTKKPTDLTKRPTGTQNKPAAPKAPAAPPKAPAVPKAPVAPRIR